MAGWACCAGLWLLESAVRRCLCLSVFFFLEDLLGTMGLVAGLVFRHLEGLEGGGQTPSLSSSISVSLASRETPLVDLALRLLSIMILVVFAVGGPQSAYETGVPERTQHFVDACNEVHLHRQNRIRDRCTAALIPDCNPSQPKPFPDCMCSLIAAITLMRAITNRELAKPSAFSRLSLEASTSILHIRATSEV